MPLYVVINSLGVVAMGSNAVGRVRHITAWGSPRLGSGRDYLTSRRFCMYWKRLSRIFYCTGWPSEVTANILRVANSCLRGGVDRGT